jgi:hypothetical protein
LVLPVGKIEEGDHLLQCRISSDDEYSGMNGILQNNNRMTIDLEVEEEEDDGRLQMIAIFILVVAFLISTSIFLFRRRN